MANFREAALPPSLTHQWRDSSDSRGGQSILATGEYEDRVQVKSAHSALAIRQIIDRRFVRKIMQFVSERSLSI